MSTINDYQRFWDGSEDGWKLCVYDKSVWLAEYKFGDSGPTNTEFAALIEFVPPFPGESANEMRERLRGCTGCTIGRPIGPEEARRLVSSRLKVELTEVCRGHQLILMPSGSHYFIEDADLRQQIAERMLAAGCSVESRSVPCSYN